VDTSAIVLDQVDGGRGRWIGREQRDRRRSGKEWASSQQHRKRDARPTKNRGRLDQSRVFCHRPKVLALLGSAGILPALLLPYGLLLLVAQASEPQQRIQVAEYFRKIAGKGGTSRGRRRQFAADNPGAKSFPILR